MTVATLAFRLSVLAAIPAAAVLAEALPSTAHETATADSPLRCEIVTRSTATGVQLEGHVHADTTARGRYALNVLQSGAHGSSVIEQSGAFAVEAGRSATLGSANFGGNPGDYEAELTLSWDGDDIVCRSVRGQRTP